MKSLNLAVIVSSAILLLSGVAQAGDAYEKNQNNLNFISKRPHQPLPDRAHEKEKEFEGATLERDEVTENERASIRNLHILRMNQISRRSY